MCGFVGVFKHREKIWNEEEAQLFKNMTDDIYHRGPDDEGFFENEHIYFGFRRLSIIDIESGHQPLSYNDGQFKIVFNGEIYNYIELREKLLGKGYYFETDSDTEVILAMFQEYREKAFEQLRGMFALLIWDDAEGKLYGARDHFGIKPLYYKDTEEGLYFASEMKSLEKNSSMPINKMALQHYLSFQFVPEPYTIKETINKLEPGHYFVKKKMKPLKIVRFFHAQFKPVLQEQNQLINKIQNVMYDSVEKHMRSDVPVGSFLSGGIDSSFIVSIAKDFNPNIKTFSVGFEREGFSEVDVAKETAEKIGVENISYIISPEEYVKKLPKIVYHLDDPLADPACVPLYFVAREAKKHVKVVLSGEGADELFGGYNIYREADSLKAFQFMPHPLKTIMKRLSYIIPEGVKGKSFIERGTTPLSARYIGNAKMFEEVDKEKFYKKFNRSVSYLDITKPLYDEILTDHSVNQMQYIDIHTWMRGDILLKADKMTMANSLELRVPFLDKEVFEIASQIPVDMKIANGTTKHILRMAAKNIVPEHVLNRKKLGFPVPIRHWLKDELYEWARDLIDSSDTDHLLNKEVIRKLLENHCLNKADNSRKIWTILMFMLWHQVFIEGKYDIDELKNEDRTFSKILERV